MDEGMLSFKGYLLENPSQKKTETDQFDKLKEEIDEAKGNRGYINLHIPGYHGVGGRPNSTKISAIVDLPDTNKADFELVGHDGDKSIFIGHKGKRHQGLGGVSKIEDEDFQKKILDRLDIGSFPYTNPPSPPAHIKIPRRKYDGIVKKAIWGENQGNPEYGPHNIHVSYVGNLSIVSHPSTSETGDEPVHRLEVDGHAHHNPQHGGTIPEVVLFKRTREDGLRGERLEFREPQQVPATSTEIK